MAGDAMAEANLGTMYASGTGVERDPAQAVYWWREAAQQGIPAAQASLGRALVLGEGGAADLVEGHMWLTLAASRATGAEQHEFETLRNAAATRLTPEQQAESARRAAAWTPPPAER
jgi:TPR repeat protein